MADDEPPFVDYRVTGSQGENVRILTTHTYPPLLSPLFLSVKTPEVTVNIRERVNSRHRRSYGESVESSEFNLSSYRHLTLHSDIML